MGVIIMIKLIKSNNQQDIRLSELRTGHYTQVTYENYVSKIDMHIK